MDFTIDCPCGATLRVTAVDAGGTKQCRCGNINAVPSLSELRRQVGQEGYDVNVADKIRHMVANGDLPKQDTCIECGAATSNVLQCSVECERPYTKGRGFWATFFLVLLAPIWILHLLSRDYSHPEVHGRELIVDTPLTLCPECAAVARTQNRHLGKLLRSVAIYEQLLQEYPKAEVRVS